MTTTKSPNTWKLEDGTHTCTFEHSIRGTVFLGTVKEVEGVWACYVQTNWDGDYLTCSLPTLEIAKGWVEGSGHRRYCEECKELHDGNSFCECGACLYKHSNWMREESEESGFPFFRCIKCKKVNFWD
jgi:hypothetical protein